MTTASHREAFPRFFVPVRAGAARLFLPLAVLFALLPLAHSPLEHLHGHGPAPCRGGQADDESEADPTAACVISVMRISSSGAPPPPLIRPARRLAAPSAASRLFISFKSAERLYFSLRSPPPA